MRDYLFPTIKYLFGNIYSFFRINLTKLAVTNGWVIGVDIPEINQRL